jgi:outer membrane protein TolC
MQDNQLEQQLTQISILNKVEASQQAIESLEEQKQLADEVVNNYVTLLRAEERKFDLGSSSLFLINSRERSLINAQLKQNEILVKQLNTYSDLFNVLGIVLE